MLINDFFTINKLNHSDNTIEATILLNASHKIFEGHFPGNPVTPGVVQIQMVKEILEKALERECLLQEVGRCKFMAIWNPNEHTETIITLNYSEENDILKISAQGEAKDKSNTFFKFTAKYA